MSRTYRRLPMSYSCFRKPRTFSEKRLINLLKNDPDLKELGIKLPNRYNRHLPDIYDEILVSAYNEVYGY